MFTANDSSGNKKVSPETKMLDVVEPIHLNVKDDDKTTIELLPQNTFSYLIPQKCKVKDNANCSFRLKSD